jgi:transcriptional regulator with XRE-family HTH domain
MDVAAAVGTSRSHLTKIEGGGYAPGREVLMALASFYDVSLDWLASGQGLGDSGKAAASTPDEALLLYAFRALPEQEAKPLLQMLLKRVKPPGS